MGPEGGFQMVSGGGVPFSLALEKWKGVGLVPGEGGGEGMQGLEEGGPAENPKPRPSTLTPQYEGWRWDPLENRE